jgi:hypothetical protein
MTTDNRYFNIDIAVCIAVVNNRPAVLNSLDSMFKISCAWLKITKYIPPLSIVEILRQILYCNCKSTANFIYYLVRSNNIEAIVHYIDNSEIRPLKVLKVALANNNLTIIKLISQKYLQLDKITELNTQCDDLQCIQYMITEGMDPYILFDNAIRSRSTDIMDWYIDCRILCNMDPCEITEIVSNASYFTYRPNIDLLLANIDWEYWLDECIDFFYIIYKIACCSGWIDLIYKLDEVIYTNPSYYIADVICAFRPNKLQIVQTLLDTNADPNYIHIEPIIFTAIGRDYDTAKCLLDYNATINIVHENRCALTSVFRQTNKSYQIDNIKLLLTYNIDIKMNSHNVLLSAIASNNIDALILLIDNGLPIDITCDEYIKKCICSSNIEAIPILTAIGINTNVDMTAQLNIWIYKSRSSLYFNLVKTLTDNNIDLSTYDNFIHEVSRDKSTLNLLKLYGYI